MKNWTRWVEQRPSDHKLEYRWRVSPRKILGLEMQPEWTEKLRLVGMGYEDHQYWPLSASHWDGYRRTADSTLEWRVADQEEKEILWNGLDLLPCPWTGKAPSIVTDGRWIGAPPYNLEWIGIRSKFVNSIGWTDAAKMMKEWNDR